jgi:predicted O-methyltransferase YrrM
LDEQVIGGLKDRDPSLFAPPVPIPMVSNVLGLLSGHKEQNTDCLTRRNVASSLMVMANTLTTKRFDTVRSRMFAAAARDDERDRPSLPPGLTSWDQASPAVRADASEDIYMPISAEAGKLLYALARAIRPTTVVEFGTSYGISTMYLAAAVRDNGLGRVVSTELSAKKAAAARASLDEAGVSEPVTILLGDALETLHDVPGPIELVLLDGWKNLCVPVLRLLEPKLASGALVVADDSTFASMTDYLNYVRDPANGYVTVPFPVEDGLEISSWTGDAPDKV